MNCLKLLKQIASDVLQVMALQIKTEHGIEAVSDQLASQHQQLAAQAEQLAAQNELLKQLLAAFMPPPAVGFAFNFEVEGQIYEGELPGMKAGTTVKVSITPVDEFKNPAKVDGAPNWGLSDETIWRKVSIADDGLSGVFKSVGPFGSADLTVDGDSDLGPGVTQFFGKTTLVVDEAGPAKEFEMKVEEVVQP